MSKKSVRRNAVATLAFAATLAVGAVGVVALTGASSAAQPASPGCFGQARAAGVQSFLGAGAPGASEWGAEAGNRASDNGAQNRAYKDSCGG